MKLTVLLACCCVIGFQLQAGVPFRAPTTKPLPNFDMRGGELAVPRQNPSPQRTALAELRQSNSAIQVEFDPILGTPSLVSNPNGFLTRPAETARRLAPATVQVPAEEDPYHAIKSFLDDHARLFGHGSELIAGARLDRDYVTAHNGLRTVVWQQQLDGIPVFAGRLTGHITRNGDLVSISSRFIPQLDQAADRGTPQRAALIARPIISSKEAMVRAAANIGDSVNEKELVVVAPDGQAPDQRQEFEAEPFKGRNTARLVWLPMNRSTVRLCWQVELKSRRQNHLYRVLIDAQTGTPLLRHCLTFYAADATYRVITGDSPTPFSPGHRVRSSAQPGEMARQLVTLTALSTNASPNGWIDPGLNELRGNNVDAHLDRNDDDAADLPRTQGSPPRVFDFPLDLTKDPTASSDAAVTELFYWCNWMHDRLYDLGFTEAAGNFQKQNFNRGGLGNDAVEADAQDGGDFNNANFSAPEDGLPGRLQMYLFNGPTPNRDADFDTEVILHEMTHGLSSRLVGSGAGISALQSEGLGEGWSDFYAMALLSQSGDDLEGNYAFGGYSAYEMSGLTENYYFGIRRYPYTTDLARNPLTFRDIDPRQADPHASVPLSPLFQSWNVADEVHALGEVWCAALWEARANVIRKWGFDSGNQLMLELVTDGMMLSPPDPNFLQARDAIIQADLVKTAGANREELWRGFAKRGMGFSATSPGSDGTSGVTESFDVPDDLRVSPNVAFISRGPEAGAFEPATQVFLLSNVGTNAVHWTASKTAGWLELDLSNGSIAVGAEAIQLTASLADSAYALPRGIYTDQITFTNHVTGRSQMRRVFLRVGQPDYFTQIFQDADNHLDFQTFTFTPDGSESFYSVCREDATNFPTDPAIGTVLVLTDEESARIDLAGGAEVALYGSQSSSLWVAANGYLTFRGGASEFVESLATHFSAPRISMLFNDLDPTTDGVVSWAQLEDRAVVTFEDVPNFYELNRNSFQVELFFDGRIRLTYLGIDATGGLVGLSRGGGEPSDFEASNFLSYGACRPSLQVTVPTGCNENDGTLTGSVQILTALDHELTVNLKSLDPAKVSVPQTVTLAPGTKSVDFPLHITDNSELDGTKVVRVMASAEGFRDGSARIQVHDNETAVLTVQIPPLAREGDGLLAGAGTVTVNPMPSRSVVVNLLSSRPSELQLSPVVVIPSGETSVSFDLFIQDDGEIDGSSPVRITAQVDNWAAGTALITVLDNEQAALTVAVRSPVAENSGVLVRAGSVRLSGTLDHDLDVTLISSDPAKLRAPATVTVPKGETTADFDLTILDDSNIDGARAITISAQAPGFTGSKMDVIVNDDETPPVPSAPQPPDRSTNAPPNVVLSWGTGQGEILADGGFEMGDLSGWVKETSGEGSFVINDGLLDPAGPEDPSPALDGKFSVTTQQGGPGRLVLYQDVTLPDGALSAVLSWHDRIRNHASLYAEPDQQFRVEIRTTENQLLATAFTTSAELPLLNDWTQRTFDLASFIGKTIRIAFVVQATYGYFNVHLDDVSLWLGDPLPTAYSVYFGTDPNPGTAEYLGNTTSNRWALSKLEIGKTYFWSVAAKRGAAQTLGPVWQFSVPGVGPVDHFAWEPVASVEFLDVPFPVTLIARDAFDNTATGFAGTVALGAEIEFPDAEIGAGTNPWESPLGGLASDSAQAGYPWEVGPARRLTGLALNATMPRDTPMNRFTIRMKHSPLRNYPKTPAWERTGWSTVYQRKQNLDERGWVTFYLTEPFQYDGVSSLLIDFSFKDSTFGAGGDCASTMVDQPRSLSYQSYGFEGDPLGWSGSIFPPPDVFQQIPNIRLSAANPVNLNPPISGNFQAGVWTGELTVLEPGSDIILKADDGRGHLGTGNPLTVQVANDLALSALESPDPVTAGQDVELMFRIDNSGPSDAHGVILSDDLPSSVIFLSAAMSQGTFVVAASTLRCDLGTLPGGSNATVSVRLKTGSATGILTNRAQIKRDEPELYSANDSVVLTTSIVPQPSISIDDVSVLEGNSGGTDALFLVRLSGPSSQSVSVNYATADGTAQAGSDYVAASGTIEFPPGVTLLPLPVQVLGDQTDEADEAFYVNLSAPVNASLGRARATGNILDDDGPQITIADASILEGDKGTTLCPFEVLLTHPSPQTVTVDYLTSDGSATAPTDYAEKYGTLKFAPGVTLQLISVTVKGDTAVEENERFYVSLMDPVNASLGRKQAVGTILNDDGLPGKVDHFEFDPIPSVQVVNKAFPVTISARDAARNLATNFSGTVTISGEIPHAEATIGAGQAPWSEPMATYYEDARTQIIYLASELGGPRRITAIALDITHAPSMTLNRWTIRLKHTSLSRYEMGARWETSGWTVAYQANEALASTGWTTFQFATPFEYDGVSNLLIDFSFNNNDYDFDEGECAATDTAEARALWGAADSEFGDPLNWSGQMAEPETRRSLLNLRLFWHDPVSVTPTVANGFVQGVWTGQLAVQELVSGMVLRADDGANHLGQADPLSTSLVDDLALAVSATPSLITVGGQLTYNISAQNSGPGSATGVVITNQWPLGATFLSAHSTLGTWREEDGAVTFEIGTLPGGSNAVATVVVTSPPVPGVLTNRASITRFEPDSYADNNSVTLLTSAYSIPAILVSNLSVLEGNTGTTLTNFVVRLSNPSSDPVSVEYVMTDGTAKDGSDYISATGRITFAPGIVIQIIPVQIVGDTTDEDDEVFYLNLANPVNATLQVKQATCRILDDDGPAILINRVSALEGDSGTNTANFTLRLSAPSPQPITVRYSTADETATAGSDYVAASGVLTFPPGTTSQTLAISIMGDILVEPDETFVVNLSDPTNATVQVSSGMGTILNDDGLPGRLDHFEWSAVSSPQYANQPFSVLVWAKDAANRIVTDFTDTAAIKGQIVYPETTVGTGTTTWEAPFDTTYDMVRVQAIYLASEVGTARPITGLALNLDQVPDLPLHRWTIRMKHTPRSTYPDLAAWERTGWTTVYQADQTLDATGWTTFEFAHPFLWNGTNHLMVDFSFLNSDSTSKFGSCAASDTTEARCLSQGDYALWGGTDPLTWSGLYPTPNVTFQVPDIRLTATDTIPIQPTTSDRFVAGQWTGRLMVTQAVSNLCLRSTDLVGHSGAGSPFQVQPWVDTDGDGLPDDWEIAHQLALADPADGNADPDGDGLSNLEEFVAGTDPRDARSSFRIWTTVSGTAEVLLSFPTVPGKLYQIESSHDVGSGVWQRLGEPILGTGQVAQVRSSTAREECTLFRVRLLP